MGRAETDERVVAGRYALRAQVGRGGNAVVWRADDSVLGRPVAVKAVGLPVDLPGDDLAAVRGRVLREARAAARLNHPSAVTVYDVIEEDDRVYIVMELIDAPTLSEHIVANGPLAPADAARVGLELLAALEAAHAEGIVHRDVKPSNVMMTGPTAVKLADFGIASVKDDPSLTRTGMLLGSPPYMAPEQARGDDPGPATDLWGLGATLYFAVEGRPPFGPGDPLPTLMSVVNDEPAPFRSAGALVPVLRSLLEKDPGKRPSAKEARRLLVDVTERGADTATVAAAEASGPAVVEPATAAEVVPPPAVVRRRTRSVRVSPLAVAIVLVAVAALAVALISRGPGGKGQQGSGTRGPAPSAPTPRATGTRGYTDSAGGWRIAYPAGWRVSRHGTQTRFEQPGTGTYLLVDYTNQPHSSPVADWQAQSRQFGATHSGYQELGIAPTSYKGFNAATWEYVYDGGPVRLHAVDLGFVAGSRGYALNFQTTDQNWARSAPLFDSFKQTFSPTG